VLKNVYFGMGVILNDLNVPFVGSEFDAFLFNIPNSVPIVFTTEIVHLITIITYNIINTLKNKSISF